MRKGPRALLWTVVAAMALITLIQWIAASGGREQAPADARRMLYETSLFQVELLAGHAAEAARASSTGDLDGLKQAAYSVQFTHERLAMAVGAGMPALDGVPALLDWIVRLQIGGERRLKSEEAERLAAAAPSIAELYDAYTELFGAGKGEIGKPAAAAGERIRKADGELSSILERQ